MEQFNSKNTTGLVTARNITCLAFEVLKQLHSTILQESPCLLVSLLMASRSVFYFLLPETDGESITDTTTSR